MEGVGSSSADSYIGCLISLISKSQIRYEGVLYTVDTKNSNIALQNVRSFGTEGRKKDGLQVAPSDKVYDYIVFRGLDIKDLEVKSAPLPQPYNDPAIIALQAQRSHSTSLSSTYIPPAAGSLIHQSSITNTGITMSPFQNGSSLYQPDAASGSWVSPGENGASVLMPVYWPGAGFYRPPGQTDLQQHLSPHNFPLPLALQAPSRPSYQSSPLLVSQPLSTLTLSQLVTPMNSSTLPALTALPVSASLAMPIQPTAILATPSLRMPNLENMMSSSFPGTSQGISAVITPFSKTPRRELSLPSRLDFQLLSPPIHGISVASSSTSSISAAVDSSSQHMYSSSQGLAFSRKAKVAALNTPIEREAVVVPLSSAAQNATGKCQYLEHQRTSNEPLLPLPIMSTQHKHGFQVTHSANCFTEDFDFTAMNEKFNKDEVWGELGKGEMEENFGAEEEDPAEGELENVLNKVSTKMSHEIPKKAVYVKDDFFDSLSCDALDYEEGCLDRTKFSRQRKIDTETFGSCSLRARGSRGIRQRGRGGGGYRGAYNGGHASNTGRRNGYYGRGRGLVRSSSAF